MKTEEQLSVAYIGGRRSLITMVIFTAINTVLALLESTWSFLFTAFFPYVAASWSDYGYLGMPKVACILLCCVLPVLVYTICWLLSDNKGYVWLKVAAALFSLDTVYMVYFFIAYGFDAVFIMTVLFHALVLWELIRAAVAAKKLANGEYEETPPQAMRQIVDDSLYGPVPVRAADGIAASAPEGQGRLYRYDAAYAKSNGANKTLRVVFMTLGFTAAIIFGTVISAYIADEVLRLGTGGMVGVMFGTMGILMGLLIWRLVALRPFTTARFTSYGVSEYGALYRTLLVGAVTHTTFNRPAVLREKADSWTIGYEAENGKQKKAVIPKAYPGLEEYMRTLAG